MCARTKPRTPARNPLQNDLLGGFRRQFDLGTELYLESASLFIMFLLQDGTGRYTAAQCGVRRLLDRPPLLPGQPPDRAVNRRWRVSKNQFVFPSEAVNVSAFSGS